MCKGPVIETWKIGKTEQRPVWLEGREPGEVWFKKACVKCQVTQVYVEQMRNLVLVLKAKGNHWRDLKKLEKKEQHDPIYIFKRKHSSQYVEE